MQTTGTNNLNLTQYGTQQIPYYLNDTSGDVSDVFTPNTIMNTSGAKFVQMTNISTSINDYVYNMRVSNVTALINDYYMGLNVSFVSNTLYASLYYSTMAFHSSAAIINTVDNLILQTLTGGNQKSIKTINSPLYSTNSLSNTTNYLLILACLDSLPVSLLNFINGIIVAFIISIMVMSVTRERSNGSKQLQYLSGTHYSVYWLSNYIYDVGICIIQITSMVIILKIVDAAKNDSTSEVHAIAGDSTLGYFYLLMFISCFSWCTLAYIWSFFFKQDIIGFIVLFIILSFLAFMDMVFVFIQVLFQGTNGSASNSGANFMYAIRIILMILW